ncbi:MAG TPA: sigma-70 family RNA polymerase sigma factor [Luteolibacter sp.]
MDDGAPDERECLAKFARDGCGESFRRLVASHEKMVRAVALRRLGDPQEAEEVAQTVFTILARKGSKLTGEISLGAWLHHVTVFECRKVWRTKQRERKGLDMIRANLARDDRESWAGVREEVDEALDSLPRDDREVLHLHYIEGRTFQETAAYLRTSAEAARKRCSRALEKLTTQLRRRGVVVPAAALGVWLGKEFLVSPAWAGASAIAKTALTQAGRGSGQALLWITSMKAITAGCFMIGLIAPFCWKLEGGGVPGERNARTDSGSRFRPGDDERSVRREPAKFDLEMIRQAFARLDDSTDPERWREAELRKLMFALNADELPQVLAALKEVHNKDRFGGIARALFARWAEIDGPAAVEMALATKEFGKEPMRGAFVTWATLDDTAALAWLEKEKLPDGYDLGREWLRWKISTDLADAAVAAEQLSALFPDRKKDLYRWVTKEWAVKDSRAAADWILKEKDTPLRDDLLGQLVRHYGELGGLKTFTYAASISDPAKRESVLNDTLRWTGVRGGYRMLKELAEPGLSTDWSDENLRKFTEGLMVNRPDQLAVLAGMAANEEQRQRIYEGALQGIMWNEPKDVVEAANKVNDSFLAIEWGAKAYSDFAKRWFTRDPEGAGRWLDTLEAGPKREIAEAARQAVTRTKNSHHEEAEQ